MCIWCNTLYFTIYILLFYDLMYYLMPFLKAEKMFLNMSASLSIESIILFFFYNPKLQVLDWNNSNLCKLFTYHFKGESCQRDLLWQYFFALQLTFLLCLRWAGLRVLSTCGVSGFKPAYNQTHHWLDLRTIRNL